MNALPSPVPGVSDPTSINRRAFLAASIGAAGVALTFPPAAHATERDWSGHQPVRYPDADIKVLDPRFAKYKVGNAAIQRLWTGALWAEGCAWNAAGRYLVWSDIPNNRQLRRIDEDGHVTVFRTASNNSNGNTFDFEGRQLSCEHNTRRVVRYEHNGSISVIADKWNGKPFNAPNDIVVHADGGIWFTDPGYGIMGNYEGHKAQLELKEAIYRVNPSSGNLDLVNDEGYKPNGLCFSPDYKLLYVADTGGPDPRGIDVYDVLESKKLKNKRRFCSMELNGKLGGSDGIRADIDGNIWSAAGWAGEGYDGVHIFAPDGQRIGMILLPEICANICFGGEKRNRLFMAASQSLYAIYVETQGAHVT
ncbi:MAG TPA: SMP-30/gluconolactonase/LRE family protein [Candidatus Limnocylindrales bacterium]|nr:SMP-30/gluconolactonase/LRE family protein [Candidatus Limnocylindrales bacterium]